MYVHKREAKIAAPMVRASTLPFRLTVLDYGADLAYTYEIIDKSLLCCTRIFDEETKTVNFVIAKTGKILFQTCEHERDRVILQLGTNDPDHALKAAKIVENDVAGIDVNMGCPKPFSTHAGMGSALMKTPDLAVKIVENLVNNLKIPVSCKIRIFEKDERTIEFVWSLINAGVSRLTVHGRTPEQSYRTPCNEQIFEKLYNIFPNFNLTINGVSNTVQRHQQLVEYMEKNKGLSVMIGRSARKNPAVFGSSDDGNKLIERFLRHAINLNLRASDVAYNLKHFKAFENEHTLAAGIGMGISILDICRKYDVNTPDYVPIDTRMSALIFSRDKDSVMSEEPEVVQLFVVYDRSLHLKTCNPKTVLSEYANAHGLQKPEYSTIQKSEAERVFKSKLRFLDSNYTTINWHTSKSKAEQCVAVVCMETLFIDYKSKLRRPVTQFE